MPAVTGSLLVRKGAPKLAVLLKHRKLVPFAIALEEVLSKEQYVILRLGQIL